MRIEPASLIHRSSSGTGRFDRVHRADEPRSDGPDWSGCESSRDGPEPAKRTIGAAIVAGGLALSVSLYPLPPGPRLSGALPLRNAASSDYSNSVESPGGLPNLVKSFGPRHTTLGFSGGGVGGGGGSSAGAGDEMVALTMLLEFMRLNPTEAEVSVAPLATPPAAQLPAPAEVAVPHTPELGSGTPDTVNTSSPQPDSSKPE
jgi:hypothetical protein